MDASWVEMQNMWILRNIFVLLDKSVPINDPFCGPWYGQIVGHQNRVFTSLYTEKAKLNSCSKVLQKLSYMIMMIND